MTNLPYLHSPAELISRARHKPPRIKSDPANHLITGNQSHVITDVSDRAGLPDQHPSVDKDFGSGHVARMLGQEQ